MTDRCFPIELKSFIPPAATQAAMSLAGSAFGCVGLGAGAVAVGVGLGGVVVPAEPPQAASPAASAPVSVTTASPLVVTTASPLVILAVAIAFISQRAAGRGP